MTIPKSYKEHFRERTGVTLEEFRERHDLAIEIGRQNNEDPSPPYKPTTTDPEKADRKNMKILERLAG